MKNPDDLNRSPTLFDRDLDNLLHPAQAFDHPREVVNDADLTLNEKRAILASWASDACAVEAAPALRCAPTSRRVVQVDEILEALRALDAVANDTASHAAWARRQMRRRPSKHFASVGSEATTAPIQAFLTRAFVSMCSPDGRRLVRGKRDAFVCNVYAN